MVDPARYISSEIVFAKL